MQIDLNCDLGEGMHTDEQIIPLISSANIACGYHAGNETIIKKTIELCLIYKVAVGAHPSWPDKENFGRTEMQLSANQLYDCILEQMNIIQKAAVQLGAQLHHVKPHGALYNQSAKDPFIATIIAKAVTAFDASLILYGLSGSISISEAEKAGLQTANEVFADRTYMNDGSLTPRYQSNALITDVHQAAHQALQFVQQGTVQTITGKKINLKADTICLHGDGKHAVAFCKTIHQQFKEQQILVKQINKTFF